jgi:hypothetical protein
MLGLGIKNGVQNKPIIVTAPTQQQANPGMQNSQINNPSTATGSATGQAIYNPNAIIKEPTLLEKAYKFAYDGWITTTIGIEAFKPQEPLSREWAARMFTQYAKLIDQEDYFKRVNSFVNCNFIDKSDIAKQFFWDAVEACYVQIMGWDNGYFMPKLQLTHQQANIIISKITWLPVQTGSSLPITRWWLIEMMLDSYILKKG